MLHNELVNVYNPVAPNVCSCYREYCCCHRCFYYCTAPTATAATAYYFCYYYCYYYCYCYPKP